VTPIRHIAFDELAAPTRLVLEGLEVRVDGSLQLAQLPADALELPAGLDLAEAVSGPAGIGADPDGDLYVADPAGNRILRVGCDGRAQPLPCLTAGTEPGRVRAPRGLVVGPRDALYVADTGNHRVQVLDLRTLQARGIWGQPDPYSEPQPSAKPGRFDEPWDLAADSAGDLYVVDHGNTRVQKFDADGHVDTDFWQRTLGHRPKEPIAVATTLEGDPERVLVLDLDVVAAEPQPRVLVYELDGTFVHALQLAAWLPREAIGLAVTEGVLYVGAPDRSRVFGFSLDGRFLGAVGDYAGDVAGLAVDCAGRLVVHPGSGGGTLALLAGTAFVNTGSFALGPLPLGLDRSGWRRLRALAETMAAGSHVRLFSGGSPNDRVSLGLPFEEDGWRPGPVGALDLLIEEQEPYLWIGGRLESDGRQTPVLRQLVLESEAGTWLQYLPAVYSRDDHGRQTLERILGLFESVLRDEEGLIDSLPRLFDPHTAPNEDAPHSWLDWLAGWMAVELEETWDEDRRREAIAGAFTRHGRRGTIEGLRELTRLYLDAPIFIIEPARWASLFTLSESALGFTTMLVPAEEQGAVVGSTAFVNGSHLVDGEEPGAALFQDLAHRFCVQVYAAAFRERGERETLVHLLDREKPAHTAYHLCVLEPRFRVGFQARIGVDSIVGVGLGDPAMEQGQRLGVDTQLTATEPAGGTIGATARIGRGTKLT
jgi:phage tail-like protein